MTKSVSLREANRDFSKLIHRIEREGECFVITRHGRLIARLGPSIDGKRSEPRWVEAFEDMKRLHARGLDLKGLKIDRDDLYDRN